MLDTTNYESTRVDYIVRINHACVQVVHNATSGFNETVEVNYTTWSNQLRRRRQVDW